jgi:hypothetical protein
MAPFFYVIGALLAGAALIGIEWCVPIQEHFADRFAILWQYLGWKIAGWILGATVVDVVFGYAARPRQLEPEIL